MQPAGNIRGRTMWKVSEEASSQENTFQVISYGDPVRPWHEGLVVDTGAALHIVTEIAKFKKSDNKFQAFVIIPRILMTVMFNLEGCNH